MSELTHIKEAMGKLMTKLTIDEVWKKYVKVKREHGYADYECRKGLWSVSGPDLPEIRQEAKHYFRQYFEDGEYI